MAKDSKQIEFTDREDFAPPGGWIVPTGPVIICAPTTLGLSFQQTYLGSGNMSHAGKVTSTATWTSCTMLPNHGLRATGLGTYTTADGCEIYVSFVQTFDPIAPGDTLTSFTMDGQITGGSGHYAGASGHMSGAGKHVGAIGYWVITGNMDVPKH